MDEEGEGKERLEEKGVERRERGEERNWRRAWMRSD